MKYHPIKWTVSLFILPVILFTLTINSGVFADETQNDLPIEELKTFTEVLNHIKTHYVEDISDQELIQHAIRGMLNGLDPHSSFLNKEEFDELEASASGQFGGLGVEVIMEDGFVKVIAPIENTPAARENIQSGDLIIRINDQSVKGLTMHQAVQKMRGKPGTDITIMILREGEEAPFEIVLTREIIKSVSVTAKRLDDKFGYARISHFHVPTADNLKRKITALQQEAPLKGLILDLRNNPGGVLSAAVSVSDMFLNDGLIVYTKGRTADAKTSYRATPGDLLDSMPLIVLINNGSASASEIVAGALQDHNRAIIMGNTSFGKGSIQSVQELRNGEGLKLTTARYFTPNGRSIQAEGIEPDIKIDRLRIQQNKELKLAISEAKLDGHLDNPQNTPPKKSSDNNHLAVNDFILFEALSLLKGLSITQFNFNTHNADTEH